MATPSFGNNVEDLEHSHTALGAIKLNSHFEKLLGRFFKYYTYTYLVIQPFQLLWGNKRNESIYPHKNI